jgi:uncharacterized protein (DUF1778 family)
MDADSDFPTIHCQPEAAAHDSRTDAAEPDGAERIVLSERDTRILLELLDNPREANERMVAALKAMPVETLPDEAVVRVDQETFDYFLSVLDEPPSGPGYERLMQTPRPWDS